MWTVGGRDAGREVAGVAPRYRTLAVLGLGGAGEVVSAEQQGPLGFRRLVALKRLLASDASPGDVARLAAEARVGGRLRHHNVVATYDLDRDERGWFLVLELVEGLNLAALLAARAAGAVSWDADVALEIVAQAADGLHHAHEARDAGGAWLGLVHRDVKPSNVMVSVEGVVKVLDLGAAAVGGEAGRAGTPGWRAPELEQGGEVDRRCDVWALGALLAALWPPDEDVPAFVARCRAVGRAERPATAGELATLAREAQRVAVPAGRLAALIAREEMVPVVEATEAAEVPAAMRLLVVGAEAAGSLSRLDAGDGSVVVVDPAPDAVVLAIGSGGGLVLGHVGQGGRSGLGADVDRAFRLAAAAGPGIVVAERGAWRPVDGTVGWRVGRFTTDGEVVDVVLASTTGPRKVELPGLGPVGEEAPFVGLRALRSGESLVGRAQAVERLVARLAQPGVVLLTGTSGVGKSSLVRAGVLPAIGEDATVVLGEASAGWRGRQRVLIVDQAEELVTLMSPEVRVAAVRHLQAHADDGGTVLLVVREDFFARVASLPGWSGDGAREVEVLGPPTPTQLEQAFVAALAEWGYGAEPGLAGELASALAAEPAAFAFLQLCGERLWRHRDRDARLVRGEALEGGVQGAIGRYAEEVVASLPAPLRVGVRRVFRRLSTAEGTRRPVSFVEAAEAAGEDGGGASLVERLVEARLLSVRERDDGGVEVEVAHEAILSRWERLAAWRGEEAAVAAWAEGLRASARLWSASGQAPHHLWSADALARGADAERSADLTRDERLFLAASRRRAELGARRRLAVVAGTIVLLSAATLVALRGQGEARRAEVAAEAAAMRSARSALFAQAAFDQARGRPDLAAQAAQTLMDEDDDGTALRTLRAAVGGRQEHWVFGQASRGFRDAEWSAVGDRFAAVSMDGRVLVGSADGAVLHEHVLCDNAEGIVWTTDGALIARCGTSALWHLGPGGAGPARAFPKLRGVYGEEVSPDGRWLAWSGPFDAGVFDLSGALEAPVVQWDEGGWNVAWKDDGRLILSGETVGHLVTPGTWDRGAVLDGLVGMAQGEHDGAVLLGQYGAPSRWWTPTGGEDTPCAVVAPFAAMGRTGRVLSCDPDGGYAAIWPAGLLGAPIPLGLLTEQVEHAGWLEGGAAVATGGVDGEVSVFSAEGRLRFLDSTHGSGMIGSVSAHPDGGSFLTASEDGTVRRWPSDGRSAGAWAVGEPIFGVGATADGGWWLVTADAVEVRATDGRVRWRCGIDAGEQGPLWVDGDRWGLRRADGRLAEADAGCRRTDTAWRASVARTAPDGGSAGVIDPEGRAARWDAGGWTLLPSPPVARWLAWTLEGEPLLASRDGLLVRVSARGTVDTWPLGAVTSPTAACGAVGKVAVVSSTGQAWSAGPAGVVSLPHGERRVSACAFSPDGEVLATASWDTHVRLWDDRGHALGMLAGHDREVSTVVWSSDGVMLASGGFDARVVLWRRDGQLLDQFDAHSGGPAIAAWTREGWLLTASVRDPVLRRWPIAAEDVTSQARAWLGGRRGGEVRSGGP